MLIAKTKSQKYPVILLELEKLTHQTIIIDNKPWHIVGFKNTVNDFFKFVSLVDLTSTLTNVVIYRDGIRMIERAYAIRIVFECAIKASAFEDSSIYCNEVVIREKYPDAVGFSINIGAVNNKSKIQHMEYAKITNPCHKLGSLGWHFNPYEHHNVLEYFKAYVAKTNSTIFDCPYFKIKNFSCDFFDEYKY
jgi:hypothetical protein